MRAVGGFEAAAEQAVGLINGGLRALAELRAQSGQQFDPAVVREALRVLGTAPSLDAGGGGEEGPLIVRALA